MNAESPLNSFPTKVSTPRLQVLGSQGAPLQRRVSIISSRRKTPPPFDSTEFKQPLLPVGGTQSSAEWKQREPSITLIACLKKGPSPRRRADSERFFIKSSNGLRAIIDWSPLFTTLRGTGPSIEFHRCACSWLRSIAHNYSGDNARQPRCSDLINTYINDSPLKNPAHFLTPFFL